MEDKIIVEYSEDKALKAASLSYPLKDKGLRIEMRRVSGKGVLLFKINKLFYREEDYPYMVARVLVHGQQRDLE